MLEDERAVLEVGSFRDAIGLVRIRSRERGGGERGGWLGRVTVEVDCATKYKTKMGTRMRERERERNSALERLELELILIRYLRSFCVGERDRD